MKFPADFMLVAAMNPCPFSSEMNRNMALLTEQDT
jgi:predicted ATPase with chaperone activity